MFWPIWLAIEGLIGLVLVFMGTHYRRAIGPTRLGRHDMEGIMRQQRQDEAEDHQVA
jgi:hypothetical protein